jgi:hypothetical protein
MRLRANGKRYLFIAASDIQSDQEEGGWQGPEQPRDLRHR